MFQLIEKKKKNKNWTLCCPDFLVLMNSLLILSVGQIGNLNGVGQRVRIGMFGIPGWSLEQPGTEGGVHVRGRGGTGWALRSLSNPNQAGVL